MESPLNFQISEKMKQMSKLETKKMVAHKKDCNFKSKAKKVNMADPGKVSYIRKKTRTLYQDSDTMKSVMERAEKVLQSIPMEYPRVSLPMIPSNVSNSYWLILPVEFCKFYMPNADVEVGLVDDRGKRWNTKYLTRQHGLSAGWRGFAIKNGLVKGDIVIFHMISLSPYIFKVNIVRVYDVDLEDAAGTLMLLRDSLGDC